MVVKIKLKEITYVKCFEYAQQLIFTQHILVIIIVVVILSQGRARVVPAWLVHVARKDGTLGSAPPGSHACLPGGVGGRDC